MVSDTPYVRGAEKLARRIETIRSRLNLPLLIDEVGALLLKRTKDRFNREIAPAYSPWEALKESTIQRKKRGGWGDKQKLEREGSLKSSIAIIKGGMGSAYFNTGAGLRIGIEDPEIAKYARIQNRTRQFLGIGPLDVRAVDSLLRRKAAQLLGD